MLRSLSLALVIGFSLALFLARAFEFEPGAAAGRIAGGMTSSPTLAAAQEALRAGQISVPDRYTAERMMTTATTSYAITYILGLVGLIQIIRFLPRRTGVDVETEALELAQREWGGVEDEVRALPEIAARAYRVTQTEFTGIPVRERYERSPGLADAIGLRRNGERVDVTPDTVVEVGDVLHGTGHRAFLERLTDRIGQIEMVVDETDLVTSGLGIAVGMLVGTLTVRVAGISIGFGSAFGRLVLGIHPVLVLGAITGSVTSGAAPSIVNREASNTLPALGYTGAHAFANVPLTVAGSVIVLLG